MNPILLSNWLLVCDRAKILAIPAMLGPVVKIDEIYRFLEDLGTVPTLDRAYHWLRQHYQPHVNMWRWDCCSSEVLKLKPTCKNSFLLTTPDTENAEEEKTKRLSKQKAAKGMP